MDTTEEIRKDIINTFEPGSRQDLEFRYGQVWSTQEISDTLLKIETNVLSLIRTMESFGVSERTILQAVKEAR